MGVVPFLPPRRGASSRYGLGVKDSLRSPAPRRRTPRARHRAQSDMKDFLGSSRFKDLWCAQRIRPARIPRIPEKPLVREGLRDVPGLPRRRVQGVLPLRQRDERAPEASIAQECRGATTADQVHQLQHREQRRRSAPHPSDAQVPGDNTPHHVTATWTLTGVNQSAGSSSVAACVGPADVTVTQTKIFNNSGSTLSF